MKTHPIRLQVARAMHVLVGDQASGELEKKLGDEILT
jgi:23S rRNA-/tRNA-specific pseudouridylate synthase